MEITTSHKNIVSWAESYVSGDIQSVEEIVQTAYSLVLKINTEKASYYLKQVPESFFIEAAILELLLVNCGVTTIPDKVADNKKLNCFLTSSCGDETLRHAFKNKPVYDLLIKGIEVYKDIQQSTIPHISLFMDAGIPDWRMKKIPTLINAALEDKQFINFLDLTDDDYRRILSKQADLISLCNELDALNIPDTLNHADFQSNNILIDHASKRLTVIDWGEAYIGNPLLSRHYCITSAKYGFGMETDGADYAALERCVFDLPPEAYAKTHYLVTELYPILHTLAWHRLIAGTSYMEHASRRERVKTVLLQFGAD